MNTAQQILNQLGGSKFVAMTGATCMSKNNTLIAKFKGSKIANIIYVTLNDLDLYDVKIEKFRGTESKTVTEVTNAFAEDLKKIFESSTGLFLSL